MCFNSDFCPKVIIVKDLPSPLRNHHPHAIVSGGLVFVSGLVSQLDSSGNRFGVSIADGMAYHNIEDQLNSIFKQLDQILEKCGSSKNLVVDVQVFLKDMQNTFKRMETVYSQYFGSHTPARTTVEVVGFPSDVVVELKVTAACIKEPGAS